MSSSGLSFSYFGGATYATSSSYNSPGVRPTLGLRNSLADWDSDLYLYEASRNDLLSPYKDAFQYSPSPLLGFPSSQYSSFATNSCSSPSTPLQALFSSPGAIWTAANSSVSPVHRYGVRSLSRSARRKTPGDNKKDENTFKSPEKKIESLLAYTATQGRGSSFEDYSVGSPSNLRSPASSALSSMSTSPCRRTSDSPKPSPAVHTAAFVKPYHAAVSTPPPAPKSEAVNSADRRAMREALGLRYNTRARRLNQPADPLPAPLPPVRISRKRPAQDLELDRPQALPPRKKRKPAQTFSNPEQHSVAAPPASSSANIEVPLRTFPLQVPIHPEFPLFYRRFAVVSYIEEHAPKYDQSSLDCPCHSTSHQVCED